METKDERAERLANALRSNLKRRKAQARSADEAGGERDGDRKRDDHADR